MGLLTRNNLYEPLHTPARCDADREAIRKRNACFSAKHKQSIRPHNYLGPLISFKRKCDLSVDFTNESQRHAVTPNMTAEDEDLFRAPESSDEEVESGKPDTSPVNATLVSNHEQVDTSIEKRNLVISPPKTRAKRKRNESQEHGNSAQSKLSSQSSFKALTEDWLSMGESSQSRKLKRAGTTYSSQQIKDESFKIPSASPQTPLKQQRSAKSLSHFDATPKKLFPHQPEGFKASTLSPPDVTSPGKIFLMPEDEPDFNSESPLSEMKRRASSSSLSSADSIADYLLEKEQQAWLMDSGEGRELDNRNQIRCPMCRNMTDRSGLGVYEDLEKLSLRRQQKFCHKHRLRDAKQIWQNAGYPRIDWDEILKIRLPNHIQDLMKIVRRETSSHYLQILDSRFKEAKGNQSRYSKYFETEIMEVVRHGYYGPKGAKLLASTIASNDKLMREINLRNRSDKTMKATSLIRLVDAVLLPELLVMLVMEDMSTTDVSNARRILSQSHEVGVLLQPDDDYIKMQIEAGC